MVLTGCLPIYLYVRIYEFLGREIPVVLWFFLKLPKGCNTIIDMSLPIPTHPRSYRLHSGKGWGVEVFWVVGL